MDVYLWLRVRSADRTWADAWDRFVARRGGDGDGGGARVWGAFAGQFGLASNELFLILHLGSDHDLRVGDAEAGAVQNLTDAGFEIVERRRVTPTIRPERFEPLAKSGLYVLRRFDVADTDVEEAARLSAEAWPAFEGSDRYRTRPCGLFAPVDRTGPQATMVLVTWYDGFASWEASRHSAPEAATRFRRRRQLTTRTEAAATRLAATASDR